MSKKKAQAQEQPYTNMGARKIVLLLGVVITLIGFIGVLLGVLVLFVPGMNVLKDMRPIVQLIYLMAAGLSACFVGIVLTVAGANTMKGLARLTFFLGTVAFIVGAALLVISLFFNTLLPLEAMQRLAQ
ncbi:MAG: hypothetical protein IK048_04880 [Clostridia bacterium]|nr:hypothetical protein [Clostridia bacterium]